MNYLIHSGPGLGDIIQFLSMARAIKEQDKEAKVDLLIRGSDRIQKLNQQIIDCQDYVDQLYWYSSKAFMHDLSLIHNLRENHYNYGFVRIGNVTGEKSLWVYRIMRICGCEELIGYGTDKLDVIVDIPEGTHYLKRNELLLKPLGLKGRKNAIALNPAKLDMDWVKAKRLPNDRKMIGLSLGTNSMTWIEAGETIVYDVKSWPYNNWRRLTQLLVQEGYSVVLFGGKKEESEIQKESICFPHSDKVVNLVGKTSIRESLSAINQCMLMIGAEGGMMHCASSLGIRTLTIFGGSDYRVWNPGGENSPILNLHLDCAPCFCTRKGAYCQNHRCLSEITPEMVLVRIHEMTR